MRSFDMRNLQPIWERPSDATARATWLAVPRTQLSS